MPTNESDEKTCTNSTLFPTILAEPATFAAAEGLLLCPEAAAALAVARRLVTAGWIEPGDEVVVLNTGAGLKYPDAVAADDLPVLPAGSRLDVRSLG